MPAKSKKQLKFMQAIANNPAFAKKVGVPTKVGKEFTKEKGMKKVKKMMGGGMTAPGMPAPGMPGMAGAQAMDPRMQMAMEAQRKQAAMGGMKKGGKVKKMEEGGLLDGPQKRATGLKINTGKNKPAGGVRFEDPDVYKRMVEKDAPAVQRMLEEKPKRPLKRPPKGTIYSIDTLNKKVKRFKKGGPVKHKGDGIATRGKTKGKFI
jgi:hypothetical protein